jgi:hypothetical protein
MAWAMCANATLTNYIFRLQFYAALSGWAEASQYFRLEGTPFFAAHTFPCTSPDITKEWVCEMLQQRQFEVVDGADETFPLLSSISILPLSAGADAKGSIDKPQGFIGETVRVKFEFQSDTAAPKSMIAKLATRSGFMKFRVRSIGLYMREVRFYKEMAFKLRNWVGQSSGDLQLQVKMLSCRA